jgi:uncharacterized protein (TIGR02246 family)
MRLFLMSLAFVALTCTLSSANKAQNTNDEAMIRGVISEMTEGFNKHDAKAASRMYTTDADFVTVRGDYAKGSDQIEKLLASVFSTRAKDATLRTLNVSLRFVTPDVALAHVTNELSGVVRQDGEKLPAHTELSIRVFVRADGAWKVAAFHNTISAPF